jgi:hypothetical protein
MSSVVTPIHGPTWNLVRNRDSWRLGYLLAHGYSGPGDAETCTPTCIVDSNGWTIWPESNTQRISAVALDAALMDLYREHRDAYDRFLAIMLGLAES